MECPLCGHVWERQPEDTGALSDFIMSEIDLLKRSNFRWCDLFGCDDALMATGFTAWGGVFFLNGRWHAIGGAKSLRPTLLAACVRILAETMASLPLVVYQRRADGGKDSVTFTESGSLTIAATVSGYAWKIWVLSTPQLRPMRR